MNRKNALARLCLAAVSLVAATACQGGSTKVAASSAVVSSTVSTTSPPAVAGSISLPASPSTTATSPVAAGAPITSTTTSVAPTTAQAASGAAVAPTAAKSTDGTPAEKVSTGGTACSLITKKDVQGVVGKDLGPGSPFASQGASQCQYGSFQSAFVLVNLNPSQGKAFYDHARNNPKVSQAGALTDVSGVGDRAFGTFGHGAAAIYFTKGDALVLVMVSIRNAASPPEAQAVALAKSAASRILRLVGLVESLTTKHTPKTERHQGMDAS